MSNVSRGAYYKARTRKWLERGGWQVADLEVVRWVGFPKRFPVKRDQFGADLLALHTTGLGVWFVQVKGGKSATGNFPEARRAFARFTFPPTCRPVVIAWTPRAREPRIVDMTSTGGRDNALA